MPQTDATPLILGGVITAHEALGPALGSNWAGAPEPGNGFLTRYAEDLALLAEIGVRAVHLGFDWSRLQPGPGTFDDDWREWYASVLLAAHRAGVEVWAVLHESTVPRWFDDDGSFGDDRAAGRWWPRWVEWCADTFGDGVAGWVPMHDPVGVAARWEGEPRRHEGALVNVAVAWRDAWRVLRGGPPVASELALRMIRAADQSVPATQAARHEDHVRWKMWLRAWRDGIVRLPGGAERTIPDLAGSLDVLGVSTALDLPEARVTDDSLRAWNERLGTVCRRAAEEGPDRPVHVTLSVSWAQTDERRLLAEQAVAALSDARRDGVPLTALFVDPAIAGLQPKAALVTRDRESSGELVAWSSQPS